MDDEYVATVTKWIEDHWTAERRCPRCHGVAWHVKDPAIIAAERVPEWRHAEDPIYPLIPLCCRTCGHIEFLDAIEIGMVEPAGPGQPALRLIITDHGDESVEQPGKLSE